MKRTLRYFLCSCTMSILMTQFGMAQMQIPNANFENWVEQQSADDSLINWSSTSQLLFPPHVTISKNEPAYQGNYAVDLHTNPIGFTGASTVGILVNGDATFSWQNQMHYEQGGGTPISFQPTHLKGFYRFSTFNPGGDQGFVRVILTRYNTLLNQRDTVSYATMNFSATNFFTEFEIPLPDLLPVIEPDSITTIFYSSNPATVAQFGVMSTLTLDSLHLISETVGINDTESNVLEVYPNPSSQDFFLQSEMPIKEIQVYNVRGELVKSSQLSGELKLPISLAGFSDGIYTLIVTDNLNNRRNLRLLKQ